MGKVVATFSESANRFFPIAAKIPLTVQERRRLLGTPLRYCVGGDYLYAPAKHPELPELAQLCWARIDGAAAMSIPGGLEGSLPEGFSIFEFCEEGDCHIGDRYIKRWIEGENGMVDVSAFCASELISEMARNPEAISGLKKSDFEALCAELFVRKGFKVDLFRPSKDDGIDFLALNDGDVDPVVFAVQCKLPDDIDGKQRRTTGVPVVREIFGVAMAFGFEGAIAISGSKFSRDARQFATLQPDKIFLHDVAEVQKWIHSYRWNQDEIY